MTPWMEERVIELGKQNIPTAVIAKRLNVHQRAVSRVLNKHGVPLPTTTFRYSMKRDLVREREKRAAKKSGK